MNFDNKSNLFSNSVVNFKERIYNENDFSCSQKVVAISNHSDVKSRKIALCLEDKHNIVINGNNAKLEFDGNILPIYINNCNNVTIKNLTINFSSPSIVEAEIVGYDSTFCDVKFKPGLSTIKNGNLLIKTFNTFEPPWKDRVIEVSKVNDELLFHSDDLAFGVISDFSNCMLLEENLIRINTSIVNRLGVGNILLLRGGLRDNAAILCSSSANIKLENVEINFANGMGLICQYCHKIDINNMRVIPSEKRYFSTAADATHFVGCSGRILINQCTFMGQMDDIINVHGMYVIIHKILELNKLIVKIMHNQQQGIMFCKAGDSINIIDKETMLRVDSCKVLSTTKIDNTYQQIEFCTAPKGLVVGNGFENTTMYPTLHFTNNKGLSNRARGLLISTPKQVKIENNYIKSPGSAVKISGDMNDYYESGSVFDISITKNVFDNCGYIGNEWGNHVISIDPEIKNPLLLQQNNKYYHNNITINNNTFIGNKKLIYAISTNNIIFYNNRYMQNEQNFKLLYCKNFKAFGEFYENNSNIRIRSKRR